MLADFPGLDQCRRRDRDDPIHWHSLAFPELGGIGDGIIAGGRGIVVERVARKSGCRNV